MLELEQRRIELEQQHRVAVRLCLHHFTASQPLRPCGQTNQSVVSRFCPPSGNTLPGSVEHQVENPTVEPTLCQNDTGT
jgi:hypothetical protein